MIICFTGIDGSGRDHAGPAAGGPAERRGPPGPLCLDGRAGLPQPAADLAGQGHAACAPAGGPGRGRAGPADAGARYRSYLAATRTIFRRPWLAATWRQISLIEHTAEILAVTLPHLLRGRVVVCDRYVYDSLIGIAVLAGTSPEALPRAMRLPAVYPLPRPALWLLIDLPAETAFARRSDVVDVEFLERRAPLYRAAAAALGARVVDGAAAPDAVERAVWAAVWPLLGGLAAVDGGTT